MQRLLTAAAILGASAVALGAYAAHGLESALVGLGYEGVELVRRIANFETGSRYQLTTAAALLAVALVSASRPLMVRAAWLLMAGVLVFSGLLYVLAFAGEGWRWLGAIVPLGGLAMIAGWLLLGMSAWLPAKSESRQSDTANELVRLEEAITHQQRMLQDLDEAVTAIRDQTDAAARRQHNVEVTVRRLVELQQAAEDLPHEKPPHY